MWSAHTVISLLLRSCTGTRAGVLFCRWRGSGTFGYCLRALHGPEPFYAQTYQRDSLRPLEIFRYLLAIGVPGHRQAGLHNEPERFAQGQGFINLGHDAACKVCHLIAMPHGFHDTWLTGGRDHQMCTDIVIAASQLRQLFLVTTVGTRSEERRVGK